MNAVTKFLILFLVIFLSFVGLLLYSAAQQAAISVNVYPPRSSPDTVQLYIVGNLPWLGNWNPGAVPMKMESDSLWTFQFAVPKTTFVEMKITRGSWNTQAIYTPGEIPSNISFPANRDTSIMIRPIGWSDGVEVGGGVTGNVQYHRELPGHGLQYPRDVIVWLPPSYESDTTKRYPVLYMHDGQNVFDPKTSFIGYDWHADEVADSLIKAGAIEEMIIVGVNNTPDRRWEYYDTTLGVAYMNFLTKTLKPMIDHNYRTLPDRENTAVMGSSMGGLISFLLVWNYPDVFSKAGCLSPAFWPKHIEAVRRYNGPDKNIRIYMDNGGVGLEEQLQQGCDSMLAVLQQRGFRMGENLVWYKDEKAEHNERAWAARLWRPMMFLFGKK